VSTCFGQPVSINAVPGVPTDGTPGGDVIRGTSGPDVIRGNGGADLICSRAGADHVRGGPGNDRINLGRGNDTAYGGKGQDVIYGKKGRDTIHGGPGRDRLHGNSGADTLRGNGSSDTVHGGVGSDICRGGSANDWGRNCESVFSLTEDLDDSFSGDGNLLRYTTNNASALPDVGRSDGRYRASLTDNSDNVTLHFNGDQGRLDAKLVEFPFDITVRNIGIGTQTNSQNAPPPSGSIYVFAGVQVHAKNLDDTNSSHVVVGHRGGTHYTIEGKNTVNGNSSVNDAGANIVGDGRADIRIVGTTSRTLTVYWQTPNANPDDQADSWILYRGDGDLPGATPTYGKSVWIGLITYAFGNNGVPFVGTADAIELNTPS
jgi:hypothetical protein